MKRIYAITFHGAHNYGSVLQAYALQTFLTKLCEKRGETCDYRILNYRSQFQKEFYARPKPNSAASIIKYAMYSVYGKKLRAQEAKFEAFMGHYLNLTEEFSDPAVLPSLTKNADYLLAGSDQIWNVRAQDFSYAYLFENCTQVKLTYAVSLGPLEIDWASYDNERYLKCLRGFQSISVREQRSKAAIDGLLQTSMAQIHVDPTLLLDASHWRGLQSDLCINNGNYILFYCLEPTKEHLRLAKLVSERYHLPVVATRYRCKHDYFNPFLKIYDAGPLDFLSLVDRAKVILTSSFHGTAFSLIYGKPFYAIDGKKDARIASILRNANAEQNSIDLCTATIGHDAVTVDVDKYLEEERRRSEAYLTEVLEL